MDDESLQQQTSVKQVSLELKSGPAFLPAIIPFSAHTACYKVCLIYLTYAQNGCTVLIYLLALIPLIADGGILCID